MSKQDLSDHLINQCKAKDRKAIQQLYFAKFQDFMRISMPYVKEESDAKMVVNDSFLKILDKMDHLNDVASFNAWASRIVRNTAIDHLRKTSNYRSHIRLEEYDENTSNFSNNILSDMNGSDLLGMIQSLEDNERLVFNLFFLEEYSHKEISIELRISVEMSRWLLYKARKSFKKIYFESGKVIIGMR